MMMSREVGNTKSTTQQGNIFSSAQMREMLTSNHDTEKKTQSKAPAYSHLLDDAHVHTEVNNVMDQEERVKVTTQSLRRRTAEKCHGLRKIVECKDDVPEEICKEELLLANVQVMSDMPNTPFFAVCLDSEDEALLVAELTHVVGVEIDYPRTLSYVRGSEVTRSLQSNEQVTPYGVEMVKAPEFWDRYGKRGGGVKVCIIDSGILTTHEDLKDGDLSGSNDSDLITPWDQDDASSHGTHVAGTIAATDNDVGVVGVAPDVSLHIVRAFDNDLAVSDLIGALNACASAGADIINMSLGGPNESSAERNAVRNLKNSGILLVAAAGNEASPFNPIMYPAGYGSVISVGAVNDNFEIAPFSTYNDEVDISAPGVAILSTNSSSDQSYTESDGTSMAAPHITGVTALLLSQFPERNADDIRTAMLVSARDYGACGKDVLFGHGVVDVMAAAAYLENGDVAAPELDGCVEVNITVTTDDFGSETTYIITRNDDINAFVYRGGPYPDGVRSTYTDSVQLEDACYNLILLDLLGDGTNIAEHGIGEIEVTYDGITAIVYNDFGGYGEVFEFGNCTGNNTSNSSDIAPIVLLADSDCGPGESLLELTLETDFWSPSENSIYLVDYDSTEEDEVVFSVPLSELESNRQYLASVCLLLSKCYVFIFFDTFGDGLDDGGLTLSLDGDVVLQIIPGDIGLVFPDDPTTRYWSQDFGTCPTRSVSGTNESN